jgi:iron complex outermembrane receptor protein
MGLRAGLKLGVGLGVLFCGLPDLAIAQSAIKAAAGQPIETVIVTATPMRLSADELAQPVVVVERDAILASGASTLGALLGNKPGIAQSSFASGASRPIIRGLDNFRVRVLENGLGGDGVSAISEDHGVPIDPLSATRVEVVRGPATLRYGSQAIGGVVNVINSRIPTEMPEQNIMAELSTSFDTVNSGKLASGVMEAAAGNVVLHLDAYTRKSDDYRIPGAVSRQDETWMKSQGIAGGGSLLLDNGFVGVSLTHIDSDYGIPVPGDPADPTFIDMQQTKFQLMSELKFDGFLEAVRFNGGYSTYNHGEVARVSDVVGSSFDDKLWEGRLELLHGNIGPLTGAIGLHALHHSLRAGGEGGELLAPADLDTIALFLFEELPLADALKLQFGARVEHVEVDGFALDEPSVSLFPVSRSFTPFSGSASLVWQIDEKWVLGVTAQAAQRAPDALELFSKGPHEATETFELGNPGLAKETAYSTELSVRRSAEDFSFEAAIYRTHFSDYIAKVFTGETCDDDFPSCTPLGTGSELTQLRYTQQNATFHGFEISGSLALAHFESDELGIDGQFDYVRAKFGTGGNVPRIPPMRLGAGLYYKGEIVSGRIGILHGFAQKDRATFETETGGYNDLSAELRTTLPLPVLDGRKLGISLIGENLLNDDIRNHVSFKKNSMLLPGRNVRVIVTAHF